MRWLILKRATHLVRRARRHRERAKLAMDAFELLMERHYPGAVERWGQPPTPPTSSADASVPFLI